MRIDLHGERIPMREADIQNCGNIFKPRAIFLFSKLEIIFPYFFLRMNLQILIDFRTNPVIFG